MATPIYPMKDCIFNLDSEMSRRIFLKIRKRNIKVSNLEKLKMVFLGKLPFDGLTVKLLDLFYVEYKKEIAITWFKKYQKRLPSSKTFVFLSGNYCWSWLQKKACVYLKSMLYIFIFVWLPWNLKKKYYFWLELVENSRNVKNETFLKPYQTFCSKPTKTFIATFQHEI